MAVNNFWGQYNIYDERQIVSGSESRLDSFIKIIFTILAR